MHKPNHKKLILASTGIILIAAAAGLVAWYQYRGEPPIPPALRKQLTFKPFANTPSETVSAPSGVKYDPTVKALTYTVMLNDVKVVVSQQATPESFTVVAQAYPTLLLKMHSKESFDSVSGKVDITYPEELRGLQTAVMNSKGALIFARPDKNISTDDWKKFFTSFKLSR